VTRRRRHGYSRRAYRRDLRGFLSKNRWKLLLVFVGYAALMAAMAQWMHGYLLGLMHGVLITSVIGMVLLVHLAVSGTMNQLSGAWGEDNTRDTLRWATRRRLILGWVDNLEVDGGDVDHLVATSGGWIAMDSKWHSRSLDGRVVAQDADRATRAARRASLVLRSLRQPATVRPVVVYWGGTRDDIPNLHRTAHGVEFVSGSYLKHWLRDLPAGQVDRRDARSLLRELRDFKTRVRPPNRSLLTKRS
jgi:hypothetical protein